MVKLIREERLQPNFFCFLANSNFAISDEIMRILDILFPSGNFCDLINNWYSLAIAAEMIALEKQNRLAFNAECLPWINGGCYFDIFKSSCSVFIPAYACLPNYTYA